MANNPLDYWNPSKNKNLKITGIYDNPQIQLDRVIQSQITQLSPQQYQTFNAFLAKYPNQSKDFIMSAVKMGLNPDMPGMGKLASIDGLAQLKQDYLNTKNIKSSVEKDKSVLTSIKDAMYSGFKGTTRTLFAALRSPYDYVTTVGRDAYAAATGDMKASQLVSDLAAGPFGETTQLGQLGRSFLSNPTAVDTGSGFFISHDSKVQKAQAKAMAAYGQINGKSFTLGRASMKVVGADPNSTFYRVTSGIIDATLNIAADPSTYAGGAGVLTKIGRGGKSLTAAKAAAARVTAEATELKKATGLSKEEIALIKERTKGAKEIVRNVESTYLKAEEKLVKSTESLTQATMAQTTKQLDTANKIDANIVKVALDDTKVSKFIFESMNTGKQSEVVDTLSKVSADFKNAGEAFPAGLFFDTMPEVGKLTYAARGTEEFVAQMLPKGKKAPVILDLADDMTKLTTKDTIAEIAKREKLRDFMLEKASDFSLPGSTRDVFANFANDMEESMRIIDGMIGGTPESLGSMLSKIATAKNPHAIGMITDAIENIWKVDGFTNIRSIFGRQGGTVITNAAILAARSVKASEVLADSTRIGIAAGVNIGASIEKTASQLARHQKAVEKAAAEVEATKQRLKDVAILRNFASKDPELIKRIISDPDNVGIANIMDMDLAIGQAKYAREWVAQEIGLVDSFGGNASADITKAMKYLFGRKFTAIAGVVAKETNAIKLHRMFGRKLDVDLVRELADAKTADQVTSIFLRHLASPETDPTIARSLSMRLETALASKNPLVKLSDPVNMRAMKFIEKAERGLTNNFVRATILPLDDLDRLVPGLNDWFTTSKVPQNVVDNILNKVIREPATTVRSKIIMDGMKVAQKALVDTYGNGSKELTKVLEDALKVAGEEQAIIKQYSYGHLAAGTTPTMMINGGEQLAMEGANYAHQFLDDVIQLRDTKPIIAAIGKYNKNIIYGKKQAFDAFSQEIGDYWRTAQLAFRVSYTLRNIGEMQFRQFFSGHDSLFNHPLSFIAMAIADPKGGALKQFASKTAKYQNDLFGTNFKNASMEEDAVQAIDEYLQFMNRAISAGDTRTGFMGKVYQVIDNNHEDYYKGLAISLMRFATDDLMPYVAKSQTPQLQDKTLQFLTSDKAGIAILEKFHKASRIVRESGRNKVSNFDTIFLKDVAKPFSKDNLNIENIRNYLFDPNSTASYQYALNAIGGSGPKSQLIVEMLAEGKYGDVVIPSYKKMKNAIEMDGKEVPFKSALETLFPRAEMPNSAVLLGTTKVFKDADTKMFTKAVDWFFDQNTKLENIVNFGPEYRMAYWDHVGRYARMLNTDDLKTLLNSAKDNLGGLKIAGKPIKTHQTIRIIEKELNSRGANYVHQAGVTLETLNSMAAKAGAKYTKELFYNAADQKQFANSLRLIFPFAQAWGNTARTWGKLAVNNPINFYKLGRAYNSLNQPGSNAIYDLTGVNYDSSQGFVYEDSYGDKRFKYPIAGSFIGGLVGALSGKKDGVNALEITAPVQALNLAFGSVNPGMPGFGPAAQFAYQISGKSAAFGPVWDTLRGAVMPFGETQDAFGSLAPAWLRKGFYYAIGDDKTVQKGVKDWASFLASTGEYGKNPLADDAQRVRLFKDAEGMSRGIGLLTALFQNIAPATPSAEIYAKIPTNKAKVDFASLTMLYDAWSRISDKHPGDYMASVTEFSDTFGEQNLLAIIAGSSRASTGSQDAWTFLNMNPEAADKYATKSGDIVPYFFPGGEAATAYYNWQKASGRRDPLSTEELSNAAEELVYKMALSQVSDMQAVMGYSDVWYTSEVIKLNKRFGGAAPASVIQSGTDQERIANIGKALQDKAFQISPVYDETKTFYTAYSNAIQLLQQTRTSAEPDLGSTDWYATNLRTQLQELADGLMMKNPAFAPMFYRVFAGTMKARG